MNLCFNGQRDITENILANARLLSKALERTTWYTGLCHIHSKRFE
jgi:glutamate decarboxylase